MPTITPALSARTRGLHADLRHRNAGTGKTLTPTARPTTATAAPTTRSPSSTSPARSPAGDHRHRDDGHQDLRRHHRFGRGADDHGRRVSPDTPGVHRRPSTPQRRHRQDAHPGRHGQRRQRRRQLHRHLRQRHHRRDHRRRSPSPPRPTPRPTTPPRARLRPDDHAGTSPFGDTRAFTQTFDNRNVGTGKTLTPAGSVNDGNGGDNYAITFVNDTTGVITARDHRHRGDRHQDL